MAEVLATYVLDTDDIPVLEIGVQNENAATAVVFDYTAWANNYGDGDIGLILLRKGDEDSYPATLVTSRGDNEEYLATWNISAIDTAIRGRGQAQLSYFADTQVKKTVIFRFIVNTCAILLSSSTTRIFLIAFPITIRSFTMFFVKMQVYILQKSFCRKKFNLFYG